MWLTTSMTTPSILQVFTRLLVSVVCQDQSDMSNGLVKASAVPQNRKGRTFTFRVDDEAVEKLD